MAADNLRPVDIVFDSLDRSSGSADNPSFILEERLEDVKGYAVLWTNIPFSYYTIDLTNNIFLLGVPTYENPPATFPELTGLQIRLNPGTYNPDSLKNEMKRAIGSELLVQASNYVVEVDESNARLHIYNTGLTNTQQFFIQVENPVLARMLGFAAGVKYYSSYGQRYSRGVLVDSGESVQGLYSPFIVNLMGSSRINVHGSFTGMVSDSQRTSIRGKDNLLMVVPVNGNFTAYLNMLQNSMMIPLADRQVVDRADMYLTLSDRTSYSFGATRWDDTSPVTQNYLSLNGEAFQICIRFYVDDGKY